MKKGIIITIATVVVIALAAAGVFVVASSGLFHKEAKGLILYGNQEQLKGDKDMEAANTEYSYETKVKLVDEELMIIREKDMQEFYAHKMLNQIDDQNQCKLVSKLESGTETPVYYGKEAKTSLNIGGKEQKVTAAGDVIIGSGRMFEDGYLVVSDSLYEELQGTETGMLVLKLNKAADKEISRCQFDQVQLIEIS
ncbi:MAG: lipoprotein BA_5634 family protein [Lachnospiraceae bacterium]|nr:lipoprotein BA_5634 family protein [Lachnospiraceae bacterium]